MRFDWYQATVTDTRVFDDPRGTLVAELCDGLHAEAQHLEKGLHGYTFQSVLRRDGDVVARVLYGGRNGAPNCWSSGDATDDFVPLLRALHPHRVTRMDSAQDYDAVGAWDALYGQTLGLADELGLKVSQAGDWHRGVDGRTLYVGSRKSPVFARLYEKGKEQIAKAPDERAAALVSPDWVRLEVVVRPQKEARQVAAGISPEGALGFAAWTQELGRRLLGLNVERVVMRSWRSSDDDRAIDFMLRQYGAPLRRRAESLGGWDALGTWLGSRLDDSGRG